ncbi:MAG TPA: uroporphyrinogen-III synthase [Nakamurella sp.]
MTAPGLQGWRVLVPRPAARAGDLVDSLTAAGAVPEVVELITIEPPADVGGLDLAVLALSQGEFAWVVFTSINAVDAVLGRARDLAVSPAVSADTRIAAVGPATAAALRSAGLPVDLVPPSRGSAAALAEVFPRAVGDQSVLLPRSDLAPATLPDALAAKGYRVQAVVAYRTAVRPPAADVAARLATGEFRAVLFTSPSTVRALDAVPIPAGTLLGAIGEPTRAAAVAAGREIAFVAAEPTAAGLVTALLTHAREA